MQVQDFIIISQDQANKRLDLVLAAHFPNFSRSYFQFLIKEGAVLLNGAGIKKRSHASLGDELEVCFLLTPEIQLEPEAIPLDILYEDAHLLIINKPAGMVVHPAPGHRTGTFVNALLYHCKELKPEKEDLRPGIVHRLDKETSGILVAAKTKEAHQKMIELFSQREIEKKYLALCLGNPTKQMICAPIGRHPVNRKEMAIVYENGKEAVTLVTPLSRKEEISFVSLDLLTGRTHQLRVHLRHIGCPILGDPTYGSASINKKLNLSRQLLHAHEIAFIHPILKTKLCISAPLPEDMNALINKFGLDYYL
jgi:23S rRNA pseudouridine1911/1915/1917 synthase